MSNLKGYVLKITKLSDRRVEMLLGVVESCQMRDIIVGYDIWLSYLYQLLDLKKSEYGSASLYD